MGNFLFLSFSRKGSTFNTYDNLSGTTKPFSRLSRGAIMPAEIYTDKISYVRGNRDVRFGRYSARR